MTQKYKITISTEEGEVIHTHTIDADEVEWELDVLGITTFDVGNDIMTAIGDHYDSTGE